MTGSQPLDEPRLRQILVQLCESPAEVVANQEIEIKGWSSDEEVLIEEVVDAVSCLANARGGAVIVGVSADESPEGKFSACPFPGVNPAWLAARVRDNTYPPVDCRPHDLSPWLRGMCEVEGANAFALWVPRSRYLAAHATKKGISKVRVGKECRPYFVVDEDRTRAPVPGATVEDLSLESVQWAVARQRRPGGHGDETSLESRTDPFDCLARAQLLDPYVVDGEQRPRYRVPLATLILFGNEAALSGALPFFETTVTTEHGHRRIRKNLIESVRELLSSDRSPVRAFCPHVPEVTLQELLVNAYIHRCLTTSAPVVITVTPAALEIQNPGELLPGLQVNNLIHCVPAYRNFLLAEGARFVGLCDKIGQGIDLIFKTVLAGGFDFPVFESGDNRFTARILLARSEEFREFVRRRSSSLAHLEEILALRLLWAQGLVTVTGVSLALQRPREETRQVLDDMRRKLMVEPVDREHESFRLAPSIRRDIETIFQSDQMDLFRE